MTTKIVLQRRYRADRNVNYVSSFGFFFVLKIVRLYKKNWLLLLLWAIFFIWLLVEDLGFYCLSGPEIYGSGWTIIMVLTKELISNDSENLKLNWLVSIYR